MIDKKTILILSALVLFAVTQGSKIRMQVYKWYSHQSNSLVDGAPKVGLGDSLLSPLEFDVLPGECAGFFKAVLSTKLNGFREENFTLAHESLPMLSQGCVIPTEPYFSAVNRYVRDCLSDQTDSKEMVDRSCVRALINLRAAVVDQLFPDPHFAEIKDPRLLANLAFAAFVKLDPRELSGATARLLQVQSNSYTAAKWYAFASVLSAIEMTGKDEKAKNAIEAARELYDQDPGLAGLEVFFKSRGFKNQEGMVASKQMLEKFPKSAEARSWAGYYQWMIGNRETALKLYREAAELEPRKRDYQNAIKVLEDNSPEDDMIRGKFFPVTWNREDLK